MNLPTSSRGIPCLPDGYCFRKPQPNPLPNWARVSLFILCYVSLQAIYAHCIGTAIEQFFLVCLGSQPATALINLAQPSLGVIAVGSKMIAQGGGINVSNGCEGVDLYALLVAAFVVVSLPWRVRFVGLGCGIVLAFFLNLARIIALFYAYRADRSWFELLHTTMAPVILIIVITLYFYAWLRHCRPPAEVIT